MLWRKMKHTHFRIQAYFAAFEIIKQAEYLWHVVLQLENRYTELVWFYIYGSHETNAPDSITLFQTSLYYSKMSWDLVFRPLLSHALNTNPKAEKMVP
jgi:hypothetical protein